MGIYSIKPKFQQFLSPVLNLFVRWKVHPTTINIMALVLSIAAGIILYFIDAEKCKIYLFAIPVIAFLRTAFNALDGMVARKLKVKNQAFGEVLNETMDRISDAAIFLGLAFASYAPTALGVAVTVVILINSYLSIVSKAAGGARQYGGFMGKADRMIYLGFYAVIAYFTDIVLVTETFLWFMLAAMLITFIQRFFSIKQELYK